MDRALYNRIDGLVRRSDETKLKKVLDNIKKELRKEGFDDIDISEYLNMRVSRMLR